MGEGETLTKTGIIIEMGAAFQVTLHGTFDVPSGEEGWIVSETSDGLSLKNVARPKMPKMPASAQCVRVREKEWDGSEGLWMVRSTLPSELSSRWAEQEVLEGQSEQDTKCCHLHNITCIWNINLSNPHKIKLGAPQSLAHSLCHSLQKPFRVW
jgi:hypothetical protein